MSEDGKSKKNAPANVNPKDEPTDLKEKILKGMKGSFTGEETQRWLSVLDKSPSKADETIAPGHRGAERHLPMTGVLDLLFDHLERYTFEFNKNPIAQKYKVQCERPKGLHEHSDFSKYSRKVQYAQGHLSTREWSLIVQGIEGEIEIYIIPGEFLIGFRPGQEQFNPYMQMYLEEVGGKSAWMVLDQPLGRDSMPKLARRLFGQLVKVAKKEASDSEKFKFSTSGTEEIAIGTVNRTYDNPEDPHLWLLGPETEKESAKKSEPAQKAAAEPPPRPAPKKPEPATDAETIDEALERHNQSVQNTVLSFLDEIEQQVETMQQIGMKAMKGDNMDGVSRAMKRSQVLKGIKDKIISFAEEWDKVVKTDK